MPLGRRTFLKTLAVGGLLAADRRGVLPRGASGSDSVTVGIPELVNGSIQLNGSVTLPAPAQSGIDHVVVVTMENRSFDHFLGWLPGANGMQAGLSYADPNGVRRNTYPLAPDYTGCPHPDPDHSYSGSRICYNNGAMDGFLRDTANDAYCVGYYGAADLPFYGALAQQYLVCDTYFASILGPTFSNRLFSWSAQTDRLDDTVSPTGLPTIFDRLAEAHVSHRYFFNNLPFLGLWGTTYASSTGVYAEFLLRAAIGALPAVSFVDPIFTVLDDGTGNDDHPHADIRNGEAFLSQVFQALATGPAWKSTVLIVTFDEWGGFFEHVAPPRAPAGNDIDTDMVNGQVLLGMRVPTIVASPFTRNTGNAPLVSNIVFDHTSALKLIEWRWGLEPLTPRDASPLIGNFAMAMNFSNPDSQVPSLPKPAGVSSAGCPQAIGGIFDSDAVRPSPWAAFARALGGPR